MRKSIVVTIATGISLAIAAPALSGPTLDAIGKKGFIQCGVSQGLPGFSNPDDKGNWKGIDVDYCRAVAAAILGDASKVKFTPLSAKQRFTALQSGEIDVLSRNTTWTQTRDSALGLNFVGVLYYDGQGFLVRKDLGIKSARELGGATVCINSGTTTELNAADYFRANNMAFNTVVFEKSDEVVLAYDSGRCDVYTTDQSGIYAQRTKLKNPNAHMVLPEIISKEPLGPVVRQGDDEWFNIARWTLFAMVNAEEMGLTSANVGKMSKSAKDPAVRRFLGLEGTMGKNLGLKPGWALEVIKQVGNYGEVFERNLGAKTRLKIARGLNRLWNKGGIQYAPPLR